MRMTKMPLNIRFRPPFPREPDGRSARPRARAPIPHQGVEDLGHLRRDPCHVGNRYVYVGYVAHLAALMSFNAAIRIKHVASARVAVRLIKLH